MLCEHPKALSAADTSSTCEGLCRASQQQPVSVCNLMNRAMRKHLPCDTSTLILITGCWCALLLWQQLLGIACMTWLQRSSVQYNTLLC
jgi:hypothetical protein